MMSRPLPSLIAAIGVIVIFALLGSGMWQSGPRYPIQDSSATATVKATAMSDIDKLISAWSPKAKENARMLIGKYGQPNIISAYELAWMNRPPWTRIELTNAEIEHNFPAPHIDMLYQEIAFNVPPEKFNDLAEFDGSVIAERTKGTLGSRSNSEETNLLAINLAKEIIDGKIAPHDARQLYAEAVRDRKHAEYMDGFTFNVHDVARRGPMGDPDREIKTIPSPIRLK